MTTVTIDDELGTRLCALRDGGDDFDRVVAKALAETVRRWEWEAAGRAEIRAMLDGPRHAPAEADEQTRSRALLTASALGADPLLINDLTNRYRTPVAQ